jgi:enoyl-CoA hydratase
MIRGYCIGGGLGIAVGCDLRIAADNSRFAIPAAKLGLGYGFSGIKRLSDLVGPSYAKEIFFTARQFDAAEAHAMGLINRVVAADDLEAYVRNYTDAIGANAPLTVNSVKFIANQTVAEEGKRDLKRCDDLVKGCFASKDYIEGRRAFMEKRKPAFTGA